MTRALKKKEMILSMTGFGRATVDIEGKKITAEIKSVNSKQFDLLMRVPSIYRELEPTLRSDLAGTLLRGKVELNINIDVYGGETTVSVNLPVLRTYKGEIERLIDELGLEQPSDWVSQLMRMPDAMKSEHKVLTEAESEKVEQVTCLAAEALTDFRKREGAKLEIFFRDKIKAIGELLTGIEPFESERVERIRERLKEQLEKINSVEYDHGRLEQELIFYIEKLDVTEEKTRLRAHLSYFLETLDGAEGQGKKLGFIAQEMGREINTLGSKSNNADMQRIVVMMKDELEQIKEQVLNVL